MGEARGPFRNALHPDRKLEPVSSGISAGVCRGPDPGRRERGRRFGRRFSSDDAVYSGAGAHGAGAAAAPMLSGLEHGLLHLCGDWVGELLQSSWQCTGKAAGVGGQTSGCSFRTGQLLTGTVPIIGETLRDASETVLSSLQLLKSGLGLAALLTIAAEFVPVYLGMLIQLGLLSWCGLLCGLMGSERCQSLLECFAEALRCMMAVTALFAGLAIAGTALLSVVGGG